MWSLQLCSVAKTYKSVVHFPICREGGGGKGMAAGAGAGAELARSNLDSCSGEVPTRRLGAINTLSPWV